MPLELIHLPLAVVLILVILAVTYYLRIVYRPQGSHEIRDVSEPLPLANADEEEIRLLAQLGFRDLGILEYRFFWQPNTPAPLWYYVDADSTTCAEISSHPFNPSRSLVKLFSWFPDHALVETYYDYGENIENADYSVRFAKHDLERTYASHRQRLAAFTERHGSPVVVSTAAQLIPYSDIDMQRYRRRRMRRASRTALALMGASIVGLGVLTLSFLADHLMPGVTGLIILAIGLPICFFAMVLALFRFRNPTGAVG